MVTFGGKQSQGFALGDDQCFVGLGPKSDSSLSKTHCLCPFQMYTLRTELQLPCFAKAHVLLSFSLQTLQDS